MLYKYEHKTHGSIIAWHDIENAKMIVIQSNVYESGKEWAGYSQELMSNLILDGHWQPLIKTNTQVTCYTALRE